jgi:hypothetical protein
VQCARRRFHKIGSGIKSSRLFILQYSWLFLIPASNACVEYGYVPTYACQHWTCITRVTFAKNTYRVPDIVPEVHTGVPRGGGGGFNPPPKFRGFNKAEPNSQFRGKYIRNYLTRILVSLICKLSGTPD